MGQAPTDQNLPEEVDEQERRQNLSSFLHHLILQAAV
jgi:hypothetical protein